MSLCAFGRCNREGGAKPSFLPSGMKLSMILLTKTLSIGGQTMVPQTVRTLCSGGGGRQVAPSTRVQGSTKGKFAWCSTNSRFRICPR